MIDQPIDLLTDQLTDWMTNWLANWLTEWLIEWPTDCPVRSITPSLFLTWLFDHSFVDSGSLKRCLVYSRTQTISGATRNFNWGAHIFGTIPSNPSLSLPSLPHPSPALDAPIPDRIRRASLPLTVKLGVRLKKCFEFLHWYRWVLAYFW